MSITAISSPVDVAVSGLRAQAQRMNVVSSNIANVNTTRTAGGGPYCRQNVVLTTGPDGRVHVDGVVNDTSGEFKPMHQPGHRDADAQGMVTMPNVSLPTELMEMVAASRAYQANAAILKRYQESVNVALELLR